jgi:hypothetical protein
MLPQHEETITMDIQYATPTTISVPHEVTPPDEAQLAAAAFLARYDGRTLDAYRNDLRAFFQWADDTGLEVLAATRPHIETYRHGAIESMTRRILLDWPSRRSVRS